MFLQGHIIGNRDSLGERKWETTGNGMKRLPFQSTTLNKLHFLAKWIFFCLKIKTNTTKIQSMYRGVRKKNLPQNHQLENHY